MANLLRCLRVDINLFVNSLISYRHNSLNQHTGSRAHQISNIIKRKASPPRRRTDVTIHITSGRWTAPMYTKLKPYIKLLFHCIPPINSGRTAWGSVKNPPQ